MNPMEQIEVRIAIATVVPKKMSLEALAEELNLTPARLEALKQGDRPTLAEAKAFAERFGGEALDYAPFSLQEDPWWQRQPAGIQAEVQRLVLQATYGPEKALKDAKAYDKKKAWMVLGAMGVILLAVLHGLWLERRYNRVRPEANRYMARIYAHRHIALSQAGIELANGEIAKIKQLSDYVEQSPMDPAQRVSAQKVFLDFTRYYNAIVIQFQQAQELTRATLNDPSKLRNDNTLLDPFTFQPIDVEDVHGGKLDQEKIRHILQLQIRTDYVERMLKDVAEGKIQPDKIPSLEEWGKLAISQPERTP